MTLLTSVRTWRSSELGQECIEALDMDEEGFAMTDIKDIITGRFEEEAADPFVALY